MGKPIRSPMRGPKGLLVVFICNHCPYVKASIGRIVAEAKALREIGIGTIAIMPNDTKTYREDSFDNMKVFAAKHGFTFPYVIDETQEVARTYGAQCTPDFFGFNAQNELQYRGRLDASRTTPVPNARRDLFEAMKQVTETGHGPEDQTPLPYGTDLEALFAIARGRMLSLFSLHLSALFRFMASYNAAGRGTEKSVMHRVMTGYASYESALNTALGVGRCNCRQNQNNR